MTRIGILHGRERAFPQAVLARISALGRDDVAAEPAVLGGVTLDEPRSYDVVLDRISHEFPYYRAALAKLASDGARVVPDPSADRAPDRFQTALLAARLDVPVTQRAVLPPREHPADITPESLSNLLFPLDWERLFATVGFPAILRPLVRRANEPIWIVRSPRELFDAHAKTGSTLMVVEQVLAAEAHVRALVVAGEVRVMRDEPSASGGRYAGSLEGLDAAAVADVIRHARAIARELGHDVVALDFVIADGVAHLSDAPSLRPLAEPELLGQENFSWLVEQTARYLVAAATVAVTARALDDAELRGEIVLVPEAAQPAEVVEPFLRAVVPVAPVEAAPALTLATAKVKAKADLKEAPELRSKEKLKAKVKAKAKAKAEPVEKTKGKKEERRAKGVPEGALDMAELAARTAAEPLPIIELDEPAPSSKKAKKDSRDKKSRKKS